MKALEGWLLTYLLNAMWQVPLVWATAWLVKQLLRREHPRVEHRLWGTALVLQVVLPACTLRQQDVRAVLRLVLSWVHGGPNGAGHVAVLAGSGLLLQEPHGPGAWLGPGVAGAFVLGMLFLVGRLFLGLWQTRRLAREAAALDGTGEFSHLWHECCARAGLMPRSCALALSERVAVPVTIGCFRATVLLPPALLGVSRDDLRAVLTHELVHVARHDFARNVLYGVVSLPVAWHPLVWLTRAHLAETRELVCDAVAAEALAGRLQYARSLVRLASLLRPPWPRSHVHAVGMLDGHTFARRVMMLTSKRRPTTLRRRVAVGALCSLLAFATCGTALALHMNVAETSTTAAPSPGKSAAPVAVKSGEMAGAKIGGENPRYPEDARKAKVQGTVALKAIISETGTIEHLEVLSGPKPLRRSALDAVRTWQYQPFFVDGTAVAVETTINVNYNLAP